MICKFSFGFNYLDSLVEGSERGSNYNSPPRATHHFFWNTYSTTHCPWRPTLICCAQRSSTHRSCRVIPSLIAIFAWLTHHQLFWTYQFFVNPPPKTGQPLPIFKGHIGVLGLFGVKGKGNKTTHHPGQPTADLRCTANPSVQIWHTFCNTSW
jgi:hypothetical protein